MKKIIATYSISNTLSINIYDILHGIEDVVIAGLTEEKTEECPISYIKDEPVFYFGNLEIPLSECIRIGGIF